MLLERLPLRLFPPVSVALAWGGDGRGGWKLAGDGIEFKGMSGTFDLLAYLQRQWGPCRQEAALVSAQDWSTNPGSLLQVWGGVERVLGKEQRKEEGGEEWREVREGQ